MVQKTSTCVFIEYCVEIYNQLRIGYEYSYNKMYDKVEMFFFLEEKELKKLNRKVLYI